jgi:CHAD domain-containing protein
MTHRRDRIAHGNFLRRWLDQHAGRLALEIREEPGVESSETLWDSVDARLRRAGFLLATQPRNGEAVLSAISLSEKGDPGFQPAAVPGAWDKDLGSLPAAEGEGLKAILGSHSLQSILEARGKETPLVLVHRGIPIASLTLEDWILRTPDAEPIPFHAVQTHILEPGDLDLDAFFQSMRDACAMVPATSPREIDFLRAAAIPAEPVLDLGAISVDRSLSIGEAGVRVLRRHFLQAWKNEPAARLGRDPEALHDFRVALRRLRAAMRMFEVFLPRRITALSDPLRAWMRATGDVRDLDVQLAQLREWSATIDPRDRSALDPLIQRIEAQHARARAKMLKILGSRRTERLVDRTTKALQRGIGSRLPSAKIPVRLAAPDLIFDRHRKLVKKGKRLTESSSAEDFHQARIRGKKLRYAIEFLSDVYGDPAERALRNLEELQDLLGQHQDAVVASNRLRELIGGSSPKLPHHTHFVIGMLAERYAGLAEKLRRDTCRTFDSVRGKRWKHLRDTMESGRISEIEHATHSLSSRDRHRSRRSQLSAGSGKVSHARRRAPDPAGRVRLEGDEGQSQPDTHQPASSSRADGEDRGGHLASKELRPHRHRRTPSA